jgi:hypothetical protein
MNVTPVAPTPAKYLVKYANEETQEKGPCFYWLDLIKSGQAKAHQAEHETSTDDAVEVAPDDIPAASGPARF